MKKILVSLLLLAALCLSACGSSPEKALLGSWDVNDGEMQITFYENGVCSIDGEKSTYQVLDDTTMTISEFDEILVYQIADKAKKKLWLDEQ